MSQAADSLDDIRALNARKGGYCETCRLLSDGPPELVRTLTAALADDTIESKAIWRWLAERKSIVIGYDSVRRHRRGDCRG